MITSRQKGMVSTMNYTKSEVLQFVAENDVKFIRLAFCDIFGTQKNISILPDKLGEAFDYGIAFDGSAIRGFQNISHSDLILFPDPATLSVLPWRPAHGASCACTVTSNIRTERRSRVTAAAILSRCGATCKT